MGWSQSTYSIQRANRARTTTRARTDPCLNLRYEIKLRSAEIHNIWLALTFILASNYRFHAWSKRRSSLPCSPHHTAARSAGLLLWHSTAMAHSQQHRALPHHPLPTGTRGYRASDSGWLLRHPAWPPAWHRLPQHTQQSLRGHPLVPRNHFPALQVAISLPSHCHTPTEAGGDILVQTLCSPHLAPPPQRAVDKPVPTATKQRATQPHGHEKIIQTHERGRERAQHGWHWVKQCCKQCCQHVLKTH